MVTKPKEVRLGGFSLALLACVGRLGDNGNVRRITEQLGVDLGRPVSTPQMYATLPRLAAAGLLSMHEIPARPVQGGRRAMRYELTDLGRARIGRSGT